MSWEDILKKTPRTGTAKLPNLYPKSKEDEDRLTSIVIGDKKPEKKRERMSVLHDSKYSHLATKIMEEIEKEGGALGMKNLEQFVSPTPSGMKRIKEILSMLEDEGKIFRHKDGDIYTHEPKK
tara:strand:- start:4091 stop:4459 length:369 start_codon:yes stop_codon:yes gene_type:complete